MMSGLEEAAEAIRALGRAADEAADLWTNVRREQEDAALDSGECLIDSDDWPDELEILD